LIAIVTFCRCRCGSMACRYSSSSEFDVYYCDFSSVVDIENFQMSLSYI